MKKFLRFRMADVLGFLTAFLLTMDHALATDVIMSPNGRLHRTGLVKPDGWDMGAIFHQPRPMGKALPESYEAPHTGVRDQGQCGSCSHFASTAVYEGLLKASGIDADLSEQNVLNCAKYDNYKCQGSFFHGRYLTESGAPLEIDEEYRARAGRCIAKPSAYEKPAAWGYIGQQGRRPTEDEVRQALVEKGALWTVVSANNSWGAPGPVKHRCGRGQTNHAITLVGYRPDPDHKGHYLFKIKNSWSASWNGDGYLELPLGCDNLGESVGFMQLAHHDGAICPIPEINTLPRGVDAVKGAKIGFAVNDDRAEWFDSGEKIGAGKTLFYPVDRDTTISVRVVQDCGISESKTLVHALDF